MKTLLIFTLAAAAVCAQTETRTFRGVQEFILENVNGPVEVTGIEGDAVEMQSDRVSRGGEDDAEVKLIVQESGSRVKVYVDYPQHHWGHRRGSDVKYTFRLKVPVGTKLQARTVNGGIVAKYSRNPSQAVELETINGSVDATFVPGLAAEVTCKTMNGGVYTDYEVSPAPPRVTVEKTSTMTRYRRDGDAFRIGTGGPVLDLRTLNGNIFIRSNQK